MKKIFYSVLLSACFIAANAQEDRTIRWGGQLGFHGNQSKFSGGDETANALFTNNAKESGMFNFVARYDFNQRWAFTAGMGLNSYGFNFALYKNYSLLSKSRPTTTLSTSYTALQIPIYAIYKFKPNCNNWKWIASAGLTKTIVGKQNSSGEYNLGNEVSTNISSAQFSYEAATVKRKFYSVGFLIGREKMFKNGSILNFNLYTNLGLSKIAQATTYYTVDNTTYTHNFENRGNYHGFSVAYFFKPTVKSTRPVVKAVKL